MCLQVFFVWVLLWMVLIKTTPCRSYGRFVLYHMPSDESKAKPQSMCLIDILDSGHGAQNIKTHKPGLATWSSTAFRKNDVVLILLGLKVHGHKCIYCSNVPGDISLVKTVCRNIIVLKSSDHLQTTGTCDFGVYSAVSARYVCQHSV